MNIIVTLIVGFLLTVGFDNKTREKQEEKKTTQVSISKALEEKALEKVEVKTESQDPVQEVVKTESQDPVQEVVKTESQDPVQEVVKTESQDPVQEVVKTESQDPVQEVVKTETQEQELVQAENKDLKISEELGKSTDSGTNYLSLALYIFGFILVVLIGGYIYLRKRNSTSLGRAIDNTRRDFNEKVVKVEPQEQEPAVEEVKPEPQEQEPAVEEVKPEPQEQEPAVEEVKPEPQEQEPAVEEVKPEPQEQEPAVEEVKPEPQEQEPAVEEVKPEPQEQEPAVEEVKDLKIDEDEKNKNG